MKKLAILFLFAAGCSSSFQDRCSKEAYEPTAYEICMQTAEMRRESDRALIYQSLSVVPMAPTAPYSPPQMIMPSGPVFNPTPSQIEVPSFQGTPPPWTRPIDGGF